MKGELYRTEMRWWFPDQAPVRFSSTVSSRKRSHSSIQFNSRDDEVRLRFPFFLIGGA